MFSKFKWIIAAALLFAVNAAPAWSYVDITVDISEQEMFVQTPGGNVIWPVSTGRSGYDTPLGDYSVDRLEESWFSSKYDDAPMPHSVFFYKGYAIHGTGDLGNLGQPASHGCVRLHPTAAENLFELIQYYGPQNTIIRIVP